MDNKKIFIPAAIIWVLLAIIILNPNKNNTVNETPEEPFVSATEITPTIEMHTAAQTEPPSPTDETEDIYPYMPYQLHEIEMLAKTVWGEAGGCPPDEQRLVIWTVLQRVDADGWGNTITDVITEKNQFKGYREENPLDPDIYKLCVDELTDWYWNDAKPPTHETYAPTAPYYYFDGDGKNNWFREEWRQ